MALTQVMDAKTDLNTMPDTYYAYLCARYVLKRRWLEAEPAIMTDPFFAYLYARDVRKRRWEEAEPVIKASPYWDDYAEHFNIKENKMNTDIIEAVITLNNGTESIIEFPSILEAEQWRGQFNYRPAFICINIEKTTYVRPADVQSVTFNKSLIEMRNLAKEEQLQRERAYNAHLSQTVGGLTASPANLLF